MLAFIPLHTYALNDDDVPEIQGELEKILVLCSPMFRINKLVVATFEH